MHKMSISHSEKFKGYMATITNSFERPNTKKTDKNVTPTNKMSLYKKQH